MNFSFVSRELKLIIKKTGKRNEQNTLSKKRVGMKLSQRSLK